MDQFNPEVHLEREEQAYLAAIRPTQGFDVLIKLAKSEVDKFILRLINTDATNKDQVLTNHLTAQVAGQLFSGFVNRINTEIYEYSNAPKASDRPIDVTEGLLDLGEITSNLPDFNILEE